MSEEKRKVVANSENPQTEGDRTNDDRVDPRDLVQKGGYTKNPDEIVQHPAVSPQVINEPGNLRNDLRSED